MHILHPLDSVHAHRRWNVSQHHHSRCACLIQVEMRGCINDKTIATLALENVLHLFELVMRPAEPEVLQTGKVAYFFYGIRRNGKCEFTDAKENHCLGRGC